MFTINRKDIKRQTKLLTSKSDPASGNQFVFDQWKLEMWNIMDRVQTQSVFNLGHWVIYHDRWLSSLSTPQVSKAYKSGDIVMADLGATNFGSEPQYEHPCIVLINDYSSVLVVPCTSVKPHKPKYADELNATAADGFKNDTRIQLSKYRWIDKKRLTEQVGKVVNPAIMKRIEEHILAKFPAYIDQQIDHIQEVALLENELYDNAMKIRELQVKENVADKLTELFKHMREQAGVGPALDEAAAALGIVLLES